jgi:hypothetical protein
MTSIVERLASRSLSGRDLGIDVHNYNPEMLHFLWRKRGTERCYTHYFQRRLLETEEYTLIQDHIFRAGFSGICECEYMVTAAQRQTLPHLSLQIF